VCDFTHSPTLSEKSLTTRCALPFGSSWDCRSVSNSNRSHPQTSWKSSKDLNGLKLSSIRCYDYCFLLDEWLFHWMWCTGRRNWIKYTLHGTQVNTLNSFSSVFRIGFPYLLISFFSFSLGWSGILIEADPDTYKKLADRGRKSWNLPVCLSTKPYPIQVVNQLS